MALNGLMDFSARQDLARRNTTMLIALMALSVICLAGTLCLVVFAFSYYRNPFRAVDEAYLVYGWIFIGTIALVAAGSLWKTWEVGQAGGRGIAESLGGRLVDSGTADPADRRLLNIVEEMSIASGVATPQVYVLDDETSINAFAAGFTTGDAVVAVTRGTRDQLDRDALQGVIAHEFSHILNGDMAMNLRLSGVVHGVLLIALTGRLVLRSLRHVRTSNNKNGGGIIVAAVLLGVTMLVVGYLGWLFGQIIKAAVSRQREYLADASAVQFTRNPDGLAKALATIGSNRSTRISAPNAEEASHLFFGEAINPFLGMFSTHPPIPERLRALRAMGSTVVVADGATAAVSAAVLADSGDHAVQALAPAIAAEPATAVRPLAAKDIAALAGSVSPSDVVWSRAILAALPPILRRSAQDTVGAQALCLALLLDRRPEFATLQLDLLERTEPPALVREIRTLQPHALAAAASALSLVSLAAPALRQLDPPKRRAFLRSCADLARHDGLVTMHEYAISRVLTHHLSPRPQANLLPLKPLLDDAALVLSALAHAGAGFVSATADRPPRSAATAFAAGVRLLLGRDGSLPLTPAEGLLPERLDRAFDRLGGALPGVRRRLVEAATAVVAADGTVTAAEAELLRLVATALEVPLPAALGG